MSGDEAAYVSAVAVRALNARLDAELRAVIEQIPAARIHGPIPGEEWTAAEQLAHLGEFPHFFAGELAKHLEAEGREVGRTHDNTTRLAAIEGGRARSFEDLRREILRGQEELSAVLSGLRDEQLTWLGNNRKYGPEPLTTFLQRYILGHKQAHLEQLQKTVAALKR